MKMAYKRKRYDATSYGSNKPKTGIPSKAYAMKSLMRGRRRLMVKAANVRTGGFIGVETKFMDTGRDQVVIASATDLTGGELDDTTMLCLTGVAQGDGQSDRDGRQIALKALYLNFNLYMPTQTNQTVGDQPPVVFLALVLDTQTNKAQAQSEDVFTNNMGVAQLNAFPWRKLENSKRFKVLWSKRYTFQNPNMVWDGTNIEQGGSTIADSVALPNLKLLANYATTGSSVASITDNSIHLYGFSTNSLASISWTSRLRFTG